MQPLQTVGQSGYVPEAEKVPEDVLKAFQKSCGTSGVSILKAIVNVIPEAMSIRFVNTIGVHEMHFDYPNGAKCLACMNAINTLNMPSDAWKVLLRKTNDNVVIVGFTTESFSDMVRITHYGNYGSHNNIII